jgi:hypothetical protein
MGVVMGDDGKVVNDARYLTDVLLLCVECRQPIKARINTSQWIRVEWIGSNGECQACHSRQKELERSES